jgi:Mn2+/Fe2+ NRAMP family transporter
MSAAKTTLRRIWNALGPGLTTGAADDDPSGIATYSQAGAQFGFALGARVICAGHALGDC